jgi:hypothetical protein
MAAPTQRVFSCRSGRQAQRRHRLVRRWRRDGAGCISTAHAWRSPPWCRRGSKMDHFYSLNMLVDIDHALDEVLPWSCIVCTCGHGTGDRRACAARHPCSARIRASTWPCCSCRCRRAGAARGARRPATLICGARDAQSRLKLLFNQFVEEEIKWIYGSVLPVRRTHGGADARVCHATGLRVSSKGCGVLVRAPAAAMALPGAPLTGQPDRLVRLRTGPVLPVPLVRRPHGAHRSGPHAGTHRAHARPIGAVDSPHVRAPPAAQSAHTNYQNLAFALFRWLEGQCATHGRARSHRRCAAGIAKQDPKYSDVVRGAVLGAGVPAPDALVRVARRCSWRTTTTSGASSRCERSPSRRWRTRCRRPSTTTAVPPPCVLRIGTCI